MAWTFDPSELRDFHGRWTGKGSGPIDHLAEMLRGSARGAAGHVGGVAVRRHGNRFSVAEPGKTPIKFGDARSAAAHALGAAGLSGPPRSRAPVETHVGITPARGSGLTDAYYNTARYKGFENDLKREAAKAGVDVKITKVRGVWAGGGEPSARATFTGPREKVNAITDKIAGKYNQDATIAWRDRAGGPHVRYLSNSHVDAGRVERALANRERYGKIEGGTVTPDGRLEIYDLTGTEAQQQIAQLAGEIGTTFGYSQGDGELRFQGEHYPGPRFPAAG